MASIELLAAAGNFLGLAKREGDPMNIETYDGLSKLNCVLYYAQGYALARGKSVFDDPIFARYTEENGEEYKQPFCLSRAAARTCVPWISVSPSDLASFHYEQDAYFAYLATQLARTDFEVFCACLSEDQTEPTFETEEARAEFKFLRLLLKQPHDGAFIPWFFNTPNHPFEQHLCKKMRQE